MSSPRGVRMAKRKKRSSKHPHGNGAAWGLGMKLAPRIKEYLNERGNSAVDLDEMAQTLQLKYTDYARKKKVPFRNLVASVYKSIHGQMVGSAKDKSGLPEEDWLRKREQQHMTKRMVSQLSVKEQPDDSSDSSLIGEQSLDSENDDFEAFTDHSGRSMMNDALLQIYSNGPSHNAKESEVDPGVRSTNEPSEKTDSINGMEESVQVSLKALNDTSVDQNSLDHGKLSLSDQSVAQLPLLGDQQTPLPLPIDSQISVDPSMRSSSPEIPLDTVTTVSNRHHPQAAQTAVPEGGAGSLQPIVDTTVADINPQNRESILAVVPVSNDEDEDKQTKLRIKRPNRTHDVGEEGGRPRGRKRRRTSPKGEETEAGTKDSLMQKHGTEFRVQKSEVKFSDIGGCERYLQEVCKLLLHMRHPKLFVQLGVRPPQGFLLHGPPGCGKTLLANAIAGELGLPFIKLAATEVVSGVSGESEETIRDLFRLAKEHAPCVLFIDDVDAICRKRENAQREMERRIVTQLLASLDDLNQDPSGVQVLVIGATSRPDSLDPALRRSGRFDREISLGIPDQQDRQSILQVLCRDLHQEEGFDFSSLSHETPGYVGADLKSLVQEASLCAINRVLESVQGSQERVCGGSLGAGGVMKWLSEVPPLSDEQMKKVCITLHDFREALKLVQPSAKREGFATVPNVTWDDVGALEDVREELSLAILAPIRYPKQFACLGLTSPPGILLAGPPGCGKTLLAKAIANQSGINFISVKGPELLNMYVGESERAVRLVFQRARNSAPCVIFFDELDALCPKRSEHAETSASARVVNQLLTEMDGLEARKQVFIMGATNRPDIIDPAVLRPGRLDKTLYVGLPSAKDRAAILKTITKVGTKPALSSDVDLSHIASDQFCKGMSGADLNALVREAAIFALKEYMHLATSFNASTNPSESTDASSCVVQMHHFTAALSKVRPSVSLKDRMFYQHMEQFEKC